MKIVKGEIYKKLGSGTEVEVLSTYTSNIKELEGWVHSMVNYKDVISGREVKMSEYEFAQAYIPKYLKEGDEVVEVSMGRIVYSFKVDKIQGERAICSGTIPANPVPMISVKREISNTGSLEGQSRIQGSTFYFMDEKTKHTILNKRMKESYKKQAEAIVNKAIDDIQEVGDSAVVVKQLDTLLDKIIKATKEIK